MLTLTPAERRALRGKAHHLHPVVSVGQHGLTPVVLREIDVALKAHGLIKVRVHSDDRNERETMFARIAAELDSAPVQHLGKLLILWRPPEEAEEKPARPARKTVAKKTSSRQRSNDRASRPVGPRARGGAAPNPRRRRRV